MNKLMRLLLVIMGIFMTSCTTTDATAQSQTAYGFTFHTLQGAEELPLAAYKGKVMLIVNTASECGFTGQYDGLEKLYETYKDRGLVIIGVPSNDFGKQEPGTNEEIAGFCKLNYGVSFPMAAKEVVTGASAHPFYVWTRQQLGWIAAPKWNFHKYLINRHGKLVEYYMSNTAPDSKKLTTAIEHLLNEKAGE